MSEFITAKGKTFRICYKNGTPVKGKEIYEISKLCHCPNCIQRNTWGGGTLNNITVATTDFSKLDKIVDFLETWTCGSRNREKTMYMKF